MIKSLWGSGLEYWKQTTTVQRILFIVGSVLFLWMVGHIAAMVLTGAPLDGAVSLRKGATFAETGWLMSWAVAYVLPYLTLKRGQTLAIVGGVLQFAVVETFLVSLQAWRGVPSHYNFATPFDTAVFSIMGGGTIFFLISMVVLLHALHQPNDLNRSMEVAFRTGTVLMLIGAVTGYIMLFNLGGTFDGEWVRNALTVVTGDMIGSFAGTTESTGGGNIVVIHAVGVHGLSLAPLAAWLLSYSHLEERLRTRIVWGLAASLYAIIMLLAAAMFMQQPLGQLSAPLLIPLGVAGLAALGSFAVAAWVSLPGFLRVEAETTLPQGA